MHLASKYGNLKVTRLLLQRDAPVDAEGKNGVTPLHVAAHYDHQNVALLLLDKVMKGCVINQSACSATTREVA